MSVLEIKKYPDPILRKKAQEIREITPEIKKLAEDMIETMLKSEPEGVGLAAPQVGVSIRMFVARTDKEPGVFINPKILRKTGQETMEEGCLSLPDVWLEIKRAREVELEALGINGEKIKIKTAGVFAKILQHEIDHLNGILIINKINLWQKIKRTLIKL